MDKSTRENASYVVLARKWRPSQFSDVVGQDPIAQTLVNAIEAKRVHQAYLFTGSRGIGKTSIARIFSKLIRCNSTTGSAQNRSLSSCDQCSSCLEVTSGKSVDVIEIDGASNNGVDAIREIRENANYLPSSGTKKIYIIDEVHMLSTAAFNALLKTLEEPPAHILFIFATTEPHKIPATILSRCQRFDFRRVNYTQIQKRLIAITQAEGITCPPEALALIARAADGSMRDALSLLDQSIAFSNGNMTLESVRESIGLIETQIIFEITKNILNRNAHEAIHYVNQCYQQGFDLRVLTRHLIECLHGVLLAKINAPFTESLGFNKEDWDKLKEVSQLRSLEELEVIFQVLHHGIDSLARSSQPQMVLDVLLIKCATAEILTPAHKPIPYQQQNSIIAEKKNLQTTIVKTNSHPSAPQKPEKTWEDFLRHVKQFKPLLFSVLEYASDIKLNLSQKTLKIFYHPKNAFQYEQVTSLKSVNQLRELTHKFYSKELTIETFLNKEAEDSLIDKKAKQKEQKVAQAKQSIQNHPIIQEATALFGGTLGPIQLKDHKLGESAS